MTRTSSLIKRWRHEYLKKHVYLDYGATTPVDPEVLKSMQEFFTKNFGNPSSVHTYGLKAQDAIEQSRKHVASCINASADEIIFTSGGTEADNLGIKGIALQHQADVGTNGPHIITSSIEHPAVLETCKYLEKQGFVVTYLPVNADGIINPKQLQETITNQTFLVSIMAANNEIGTIQPLKEIGAITHKNNILFHTDAVQAIGKIPIDVQKMHIDLLSLSSHKIYGPKGIGALFVRKGVPLTPLFHGGGHEQGKRSSTLNTPGIIALGKACELAKKRMKTDVSLMTKLRDQLIKNVLEIEETYLNGHSTKRLANNAHFRFTAVEGESIHLMLDNAGIAAATGSACSSKKLKPSHVLLALGLTPEESHGSIRFSLGRMSTKEDITYVIETLPGIIQTLRDMSPLWKNK